MKRGGQRGEVAVNVDRIAYVAATPGPFTDIYFGDFHVTVEGTFHQVCARLSAEAPAAPAPEGGVPRSWLQQRG
ncbi:MAG TPA: hypothetical protein VH331_06140 [Allosphingosinicella sp.]|jgi:hypothetical protein|nr:hypothetical protein [Allosphingosinicella sp.]